MKPQADYHSALRHEGNWPAVMRYEINGSVALCHDAINPLPAEFASCDVIYGEPPWRRGIEEFDKRAGVGHVTTRPTWQYMVKHWHNVATRHAAAGKPTLYTIGKEFLRHMEPDSVQPVFLNGGEILLAGYGKPLPAMKYPVDVVTILERLAEEYSRIGDFFCGYGRAGRVFASRGRSFVISDYSAKVHRVHCRSRRRVVSKDEHGEAMKIGPLTFPNLPPELDKALGDAVNAAGTIQERMAIIGAVRQALHGYSPVREQPIDRVLWVPIEFVTPNDYNPNSVAKVEMRLLYTSISHDGYTQPVVTIYDPGQGKFVIVDGFHRYYTMKTNADIFKRNHGLLPCVVIDKGINDRMASTVRHNRARGKHSVGGMSTMVFAMLQNGWEDAAICNELGMSPEELLRLKHITGFSKLFEDTAYRQAWQTERQVKIAAKYRKDNPDDKLAQVKK